MDESVKRVYDQVIQEKNDEIAVLKAKVEKLERSIFIKKEIEEIDEALEYDLEGFIRNLLKRYKAMLEEDLDD